MLHGGGGVWPNWVSHCGGLPDVRVHTTNRLFSKKILCCFRPPGHSGIRFRSQLVGSFIPFCKSVRTIFFPLPLLDRTESIFFCPYVAAGGLLKIYVFWVTWCYILASFFFFLSLGPWPSPLSGFLWIREYLYSLLVDTNFP